MKRFRKFLYKEGGWFLFLGLGSTLVIAIVGIISAYVELLI